MMEFEIMSVENLEHSNDKYRNNPQLENIHRQTDFYKAVHNSIKKEGIINPIIIHPEPLPSGKYKISIGNNRWLAAKKLGLKDVPIHKGEYSRMELKQIPVTQYIEVNY